MCNRFVRHAPYSGDPAPTLPPRTLKEWFERGRLCFHQPDGLGAVAAMEKVIRLHPGYRHPDGDNPYYYLGKINEVEGRLSVAIVFYSRALALDYQDEDSLIGRGACYTVTGHHEAAVHDFEWLLRLPKNCRRVPDKHLYLMLAENHRKLGRWGEAIIWREMARDAAPGDAEQQSLYQSLVQNLADPAFYQ